MFLLIADCENQRPRVWFKPPRSYYTYFSLVLFTECFEIYKHLGNISRFIIFFKILLTAVLSFLEFNLIE